MGTSTNILLHKNLDPLKNNPYPLHGIIITKKNYALNRRNTVARDPDEAVGGHWLYRIIMYHNNSNRSWNSDH